MNFHISSFDVRKIYSNVILNCVSEINYDDVLFEILTISLVLIEKLFDDN